MKLFPKSLQRVSPRAWTVMGILIVSVALVVWWFRNPRPDDVRSFAVATAGATATPVTAECFFPPGYETSKGNLPTVVILHGVEGTSYYRSFHLTNARKIADEGYAVVLVHYFDPLPYSDLAYLKSDYSLDTEKVEEHIYGDQIADRRCWEDVAVESIKWAADQPEMDSEKLFLVGYSLGGCVALSCADRCSRETQLPSLKGIVVNFASRFRDVELSASLPATQFHHGQDDDVIQVDLMQQTADEMKANGTDVDVNIYPDQEHILDDACGKICRQRTHEFLFRLLQPDT